MMQCNLYVSLLQDLLAYLYTHGPTTPGIFRKAPNQKNVRELREWLDSGEDFKDDTTNPLTVASTLKVCRTTESYKLFIQKMFHLLKRGIKLSLPHPLYFIMADQAAAICTVVRWIPSLHPFKNITVNFTKKNLIRMPPPSHFSSTKRKKENKVLLPPSYKVRQNSLRKKYTPINFSPTPLKKFQKICLPREFRTFTSVFRLFFITFWS